MTKPFSSPLSRRRLIRLAGGGAAAAAVVATAPKLFAPAIAGPAPKVRLAWTEVAACHSPMAFGAANGFYAKEGVDVELFYQGASGQTLIQALATNKADVGAGLVLDWLKPLEQGFDVKLFVGSHGGCQRLLAAKSSGITDIAGLKGKRIATWEAGAPPKVAFSVALAKAGLDPEQDVTWVYAPFDLVGETVKRGNADVAAHMDPWAYNLQKTYDLVKIADTQSGVYAGRTCCVLGVNGPFLAANKDAVRRIATANLAIHEYTAAHPDEVAKWYADNLKPGMTADALADDLGSLVFHNHPIGKELVHQIQLSYEDLKLTKVIDPDTDPAEIAQRVTVDILAA